MQWEERARKIDARRRYMQKHGYSVFVIEAAERKRAAAGKVAVGKRARKAAERRAHGRKPGQG